VRKVKDESDIKTVLSKRLQSQGQQSSSSQEKERGLSKGPEGIRKGSDEIS